MPTEEKTENLNDSKLVRFLSHPLTKLTEFILAVIGLYSLVVPDAAPDLILGEKSPRTKIVTPGQATSLTVMYNGQKLDEPVVATKLVLWNNGRSPSYGTAQRGQVKIVLNGGARILEAKVSRANRPEIEATLTVLGEANSELSIVWNLLEQGDAFEIQLIYAGDEKAPISITGSVVGQKSIRFIQHWTSDGGMLVFSVIGSLLGCAVAMAIWEVLPKVYRQYIVLARTPQEKWKVRSAAATFVVFVFTAGALIIWLVPWVLVGPRVPVW